MHWILLTLAILAEVAGTTTMKLSEGFSRLTPSLLLFVFYASSLTFFERRLNKFNDCVLEGNEGSSRMMQKLGCVQEGVRRQIAQLLLYASFT